MQVTIITRQTSRISWSPGALTSSCVKGPPVLQTHHMHFSPLLTFLFLFKTMLKCDFLHGAFLCPQRVLPTCNFKALVCGFEPRQAGEPCQSHGSHEGLTQEAPSPCLLKEGSAQGPETASLLMPWGSWRMGLALVPPTLHWKLARLDSGRWQEAG